MSAQIANLIGKGQKYLGNATMKVTDFSSERKEYTIPLIDPETKFGEASLTICGQLISREEAMNIRVDIAFQYERFLSTWSVENLLPTDPGQYVLNYKYQAVTLF